MLRSLQKFNFWALSQASRTSWEWDSRIQARWVMGMSTKNYNNKKQPKSWECWRTSWELHPEDGFSDSSEVLCAILLQAPGLWPPRLLCSWGSPGKNTGGGRHFLLQVSSWPRDPTCCPCVSCIGRWWQPLHREQDLKTVNSFVGELKNKWIQRHHQHLSGVGVNSHLHPFFPTSEMGHHDVYSAVPSASPMGYNCFLLPYTLYCLEEEKSKVKEIVWLIFKMQHTTFCSF